MVNFLKVFDPIRIIVLILLLLAIRLPFIIKGIPLTIPELEWMLTGERLADGWVMYRDMWHYIEPLSATTYFIVDLLFDKSQSAYQVISILLVLLQASLLNYISNTQNLFNEKSVIPATIYIILSSIFFDFFTLPPVLMANTFMISAFYFFVLQIRYKLNDENMFFCGLLMGIATLFYLPSFIFLLIFIFGFILYAATEPRKYLLLIVSFLFPVFICFTYYFLRDGSEEFIKNFILPFFTLEETKYIETGTILLLIITPGIMLLLSLLIISTKAFYINYQHNMIRILILWLFAGILTLFLTLRFAPFQLYILVPPMALLISHFFLLFKSKLLNEAFFWTMLGIVLLINAGVLYGFVNKKNPISLAKILVGQVRNRPSVDLAAKKILVLGNEPSLYAESSLATPYYNWELSERHFKNLNKLEVLPEVYQNFQKDLPEFIIDRESVIPALFKRLPLLGIKYKKLENEDVYVLLTD